MTPSLEIGNGNWAVQSDSLLGYKTINGKYYPREMSVTRATTATRVNAAGLIELVPYNLVPWSEQLDNVSWGKLNASITANTTTAPNGTLTADKVIPNTISGIHNVSPSLTFTASTTYTTSVYAKKAEYSALRINYISSANTFVSVNLDTGVIANAGGTIYLSSSITDVGDGWYRITMTFTPPIGTSALNFIVENPVGTISFTGDGTSGLYLWGAQLVEGTQPLNYLPTTTRLNIPRIDYSTGEAALLVEPQRTNYLSDSRIDTWVNLAGSTPTTMLGLGANTVENNSGVVSSASFAGNIRLIGNQVSLSVVSGNVVTYSFYARKENTDGNVVDFWLFGNAPNTVRFQPRFNFETNTLIQLQTPINITNTNIRSTNVGNDIYLIEATFEATASTTLTANHITTYNIGGITTFGHPQVELGASATSPIVSTGTILTRNADVIFKTGIADLIGQTEGTIFFDIQTVNTANIKSISINSVDFNNYMYYYESNNNYYFIIVSGGVTLLLALAAQTLPSRKKIALRYSQNNFSMWINGVKRVEKLEVFNPPSGLNKMQFMNPFNQLNTVLDSKINSVLLFKTALSNTELSQLTTI